MWIGRVVCLLVGLIVGSDLTWLVRGTHRATFEVIGGSTTAVSQDGRAIGLGSEPGSSGVGYQIEGAWWREEGGSWHTRGPTCLEPLQEGQQVRLGVVHLRRTSSPR